MYEFAIDMSAGLASLALTEKAACRAAFSWSQKQYPHQHLFAILPGFLRDAGVAPEEIGLAVVGLGPGAFSGIRIALAAANGLALPGGVAVRGLPSSAALAWEARGQTTSTEIITVGDARRSRCWLARYRLGSPAGLDTLAEPVLVPVADLAAALSPQACVVTPDWERLGAILEAAVPASATLLRAPHYPTARALAEIAGQRLRRGAALHPPQPIYLHPAV
ncbi:MAG: tRNA (adenosine(37)-N6)-threonylcarbamoyltransferase complex dimerization subunit type 1 TsaB [Lentisphaerae bacterium]|nr:tRNA (adenosine(37)-N6)-threonylcarbamoyltransferase complex dimerization subunit type 1 TsaB [Lentisphaerota bacterium]